jgi:two-component system OmpR family response regulator
VSEVTTEDAMLRVFQLGQVNLIIMDWVLAGSECIGLLQKIRNQYGVPIIMLSARNTCADRVMGLKAGADDYIGKPCDPSELTARIQAVLRRWSVIEGITHVNSGNDIVCFDRWELHRDSRNLLSPTGMSISLSNAEFRLLDTFLRNPGRLCSRDQLMEKARGRGMDVFERSIDLLVSRLRHKITDGANEAFFIKTIRGAGYMFDAKSIQKKWVRDSLGH